jgi:hypothetical protein
VGRAQPSVVPTLVLELGGGFADTIRHVPALQNP